ncbi:MAG: 2-oxoglutarate dehydrogenase, E2 component, dihydrolipoamide succinyltransferase [Calditrichaeota bacterium]|nr:2-oxoglutarate dehydrogenase, E2 component, dihydrolipoamide succinyltransferase [Calditrichota bacterium]
MKQDVLMPKLGESITEGTIVKWWKKPGDRVEKDETLLEISTDKVDSEIPSPFSGTLVEVKANESDVVQVDSVIAIIDDAGGAAAAAPSAEPAQTPAASTPAPPPAAAPASNGHAGGVSEVEMPKLGESITEGTIVKWWKKPGDKVSKDETLLEISTDKVDSEIPSPYSGTLKEVLANEGDVVEVGSVIARIASGDAPAGPSGSAAPAPQPVAQPASAPAPQAAVEVSGQDIPRTQGGRFYSPLVRSIARKEGISKEELAGIPGTGLEGRVTKKDILAYLDGGRKAVAPAAPRPVATPAAAPAPAAARPAPQPSVSSEEVAQKYAGKRVEVIPMDNIRRKIAEHMVMSKSTSPHVYGVAETDFTRVMSLVKKHRDSFKAREGIKLTMNPFILYSVSKALVDFPDINSSVDGSNIIRKNYINVGMAVATEHGLLVPTLKNTDQMNFRGIALNAYDLAIKARDRKLTLDQIQDSTFTVTNYGVFGNVIGYPIINQPNVAILGVAAVKKRPVVLETEAGDVIAIRQIGYMTLSYDHRLVDGELGDKFLQRVVHYLENFEESWL